MNSYPMSQPYLTSTNTITKRSREYFYNQYLICCASFFKIGEDLLETQVIFDDERVWPDQCHEAICIFVNLQKANQNLFALLNKATMLPDMIKHQRYSILLLAHQIDAQSQELTSFVGDLFSLKFTSSQSKSTYKEIRFLLRSLNSNLGDLVDAFQVERVDTSILSSLKQPNRELKNM